MTRETLSNFSNGGDTRARAMEMIYEEIFKQYVFGYRFATFGELSRSVRRKLEEKGYCTEINEDGTVEVHWD